MSEDLGKVSIELTLDGPRTEKLLESVLASASPLAKQTIADRVIMQVVESVDLEKVALGGVTAFLASAAATDEMIQKAAKKAPKATLERKAKVKAGPGAVREGTKTAQVIEFLEKPRTLNEIVAFTDLQPHSARGFIAGTLKGKLGLKVESVKVDKVRTYQIVK